MITLLWSMLAARRGQAAVLVLLSVFATAAAVAGPVYLAAVDRATVRNEVAGATPTERTVRLFGLVETDDGSPQRFDNLAASLLTLPGFTRVHSIRFGVLGVDEGDESTSSLTFRDDVCAHLAIVAGRCLMAANDLLLGESTARRRGLAPGATVVVAAALYNESLRRFVPAGPPVTLTVAGVYRPVDPDELYWTRTAAFSPGAPDTVREPVFATRAGVAALRPWRYERAADAVPGPGAFTAAGLPALRSELDDLRQDLGRNVGADAYANLQTDLPALLDRIDSSRAPAGRLVPVAAVPLVALCWFVIFLAVAFGAAARRHELGLLALRGVRSPVRWWFAAGESTAAILVGAPIGLLAGVAGVGLAAQARFGAGPVGAAPWWAAGAAVWWGALAAVGGAVLAGALAQRREVASPVVDLLRRVPARQVRWRSLAIEAATVLLAVLATVQLRGFGGELVGLSVLVPGLVTLAAALVGARLLMPLAARFGGRALRRGRLAPALGLLRLARRPGGQRLFVLLTVAVASVCFAAMAVDVADRARTAHAAARTGADRALTVAPVEAGALLRAVRAVDPEGAYAMAVGRMPAAGPIRPSMLLVDSAALTRVAVWRPDFGPLDAAGAARILHPATGAPFVLRGTRAELTVRGPARLGSDQPQLILALRPLTDGLLVRAPLEPPTAGLRRYAAEIPGCVDGCRVVGIQVRQRRPSSVPVELLLSELRSGPSGQVVIGPADFAARWRTAADPEPRPGGPGLRLTVQALAPPGAMEAVPVDAPAALPVILAGAGPVRPQLDGLDGELRPAQQVAGVAALPRLGGQGLLADLEYAERQSTGGTRLPEAEVWLSPGAPAGVADRLREQGLVVTGETTMARERARLDQQGAALATWFYLLAGGFAVLLALSGLALLALVDRRRVEDVRVLRRQGLPRRTVRRAGGWTYQPVVAAALLTGALAAGAAWWVAGEYLPVFVDDAFRVSPPRWPEPLAVLGPWSLVAAGFATAAVGLGWASRVRD